MTSLKTRAASAILSSAVTCSALSGISAAAVQLPSNLLDPPYTETASRYADYESYSNDFLTLDGKANGRVRVRIYQTSPERKDLLLFEDYYTEESLRRVYALEPGDYRFQLSIPVTADAPVFNSLEHPFTVENADYTDEFIATWMNFDFDARTLAEDADKAPKLTVKDPAIYTDKKNGDLYRINSVVGNFFQYDGKFGDYDGNGSVDIDDAISVLKYYSASLTGESAETLTARQKAVTDADADGQLTVDDALSILQYYTQGLLSQPQTWTDVD